MPTKKSDTTIDESNAAAVAQTIDQLLEKALTLAATDVHFEPRERNVVVRMRIDGLLQEAALLPTPTLAAVMHQLKTRTQLDTAETQRPQAGSFAFHTEQFSATLSLATMPTIYGERASIHVRPEHMQPANLAALGYWGSMLTDIAAAVAEPHGFIIAASPNYVGTSLSLLGLSHLLDSPTLTIATVEDPLAGTTFSAGLRAVLKQNADVIIISRLHERQAAELAVDASLNGRLLLGGLHAASAAQAVTHLSRLHGQAHTVAAACKLALGQRFVRRLCPECREPYRPTEAERQQLKHLLKLGGVRSMRALHDLERQALAAGLGPDDLGSLGTTESALHQLWRAAADGCEGCNFKGYQGRVGICEVLVVTDRLKKLIATQSSAAAIQQQAVDEGMRPLALDGLLKAVRGLTSLEELATLEH